jgi:hypothetical protein
MYKSYVVCKVVTQDTHPERGEGFERFLSLRIIVFDLYKIFNETHIINFGIVYGLIENVSLVRVG